MSFPYFKYNEKKVMFQVEVKRMTPFFPYAESNMCGNAKIGRKECKTKQMFSDLLIFL